MGDGVSTDIVALCIRPDEHIAVVSDATRQDVIDCLYLNWIAWPYSTRLIVKIVISTYVDVSNTKRFRDGLAKLSNEQLATFLYDVWDNGDLVMTTTRKQ